MASPKQTVLAQRTGGHSSPPRPSVLVTGASGGIGRAVCLAFGAAGWHIGMHYHRRKADAEKTLQAVQTAGGTGALYGADIRGAESVRRMVETFCQQSPPPYAFICNAGIAASSLLLRQQNDEWINVVQTNLTGTFHCLQAMAPPLLDQGGGSIVVIGSHAGLQGSTGQAAYAASKAGLMGLVKTAAKEWGPENVRVNLLLPGWQRTGMSENTNLAERDWQDHAIRRPPALEEVARTIVYVAQLNDISGQVWNCDSRDL